MVDYLEQHGSIKIYYPEGEVDFVAAPSLTANPVVPMEVAERTIRVETSVEIVAKKVRFRARDFKARDLFDLAVVLQREPDARPWLADLLTEHSATIRHRLESMDQVLRADFAQLDLLGSQPDYDECLSELEASLRSAK
jgi:predicted nucleotidyltransferase component of viral defense system